MARAITSPELALLRSEGQWCELFMAVLVPNVIYTARLASLPGSNDQVYEISYNTGSGTLGNVKPGMLGYVGTTAGAYNLGFFRVRVAPDASKFYIGETSEITWQGTCHLTIVDDFDMWPRHIHVEEDGGLLMDVNIPYVDQHESFDPVPVLGPDAVLWLEGASVSVVFPASDSWVFDSTIASYAWTAPGSSASSGMSTALATITYNAAGNYRVYCTVIAANGKTTTGVRNVFVHDDDNPPATVFQLANCEGSFDSGGWMFDVTMQAEATLTEIRAQTLVVLFARDYYEGTEQSIGPIEGRENVIVVGRVAGESIRWDPVAGQVHFTVYGPHYWLNKIKVSACQLNFTNGSPGDWDEVKNLNVDRGLWHLLHWRSTATTIMDFYPTNDTRYTNKLATLANFLWSQLVEFAGLHLMAHMLCDRYGRSLAGIDPQMVPEVDRDGPTVMTVTTDDWMDVIEFERVTVHETGQVNITTRLVNSSGVSSTLYSLSPGHMPRKHGDWELNDGMLAISQAGSNQMAGLLLGWRNNEFPNIPLKLAENNRMIDICPQQFLDITIDPADTPRGISYSGRIIPRRVALRYDSDARSLSVEVNTEAETFEQVSSNGDVPGSSNVDLSFPPLPGLPSLPDIPIIIPGTSELDPDAELPYFLHSTTYGLLYTANINIANPQWISINSGLTAAQYQPINIFFVTPNGALYAAYAESVDSGNYLGRPFFIARAPSIGGTFTIIKQESDIRPSPITGNWGLFGAAHNPLAAESVGFVIGKVNIDKKFWIGAGSSFAAGASVDPTSFINGGLTYGFGAWLYARYLHFSKIAPAGSSVLATGSPAIDNLQVIGAPLTGHVRAGTTGRTFHMKDVGGGLVVGENNLATITTHTYTFIGTGLASDPTGSYLMGRHDTGAKGKSSDGGATWLALSGLPPGNWWWSYAGGVGIGSWWVAAGGSSIRLSKDFGTTWLNREGNLLSVAPIPNINMVKGRGF